jgi:hypothetical protein
MYRQGKLTIPEAVLASEERAWATPIMEEFQFESR